MDGIILFVAHRLYLSSSDLNYFAVVHFGGIHVVEELQWWLIWWTLLNVPSLRMKQMLQEAENA